MMKINPTTMTLNTVSKPCGLPRDIVLSTELVTAIRYNQCGCNDMNSVGSCNSLILFFSRNNTQLCSILTLRVNAINGLRDKGMKSTSYTTKKGIKPLTLNHLVEGSNPSRPKGFTTIEDFTLDRTLDRQENHSEAKPKAYKDYRDRFNEMSDLISPCQLSGITGRFNCQGILKGSRRKRERD